MIIFYNSGGVNDHDGRPPEPYFALMSFAGFFALSGKKNGWLARTRRITFSRSQREKSGATGTSGKNA